MGTAGSEVQEITSKSDEEGDDEGEDDILLDQKDIVLGMHSSKLLPFRSSRIV
jgi:hypothetical protein